MVIGDLVLAHPQLVLRHLGEVDLSNRPDKLKPRDRIEIGLEHALRTGIVNLAEIQSAVRFSRAHGDALLREIFSLRGDEPPAESYAEVRMHQWLRSFGIRAWRQVPVYVNGRLQHRVDALVPFGSMDRPPYATPEAGLIVELDSREFHEDSFERDHQRQTTYDTLGLAWMSFTPNQIERQPSRCREALERRVASARISHASTTKRRSLRMRTAR